MYFLTCACVDLYAALLLRLPGAAPLPVRALHGRMKQAAREAVLADFTDLPAGKPPRCTARRFCSRSAMRFRTRHEVNSFPAVCLLMRCCSAPKTFRGSCG